MKKLFTHRGKVIAGLRNLILHLEAVAVRAHQVAVPVEMIVVTGEQLVHARKKLMLSAKLFVMLVNERVVPAVMIPSG